MFLCTSCRERLSFEGDPPSDKGSTCEICGGLLDHIDDYFRMFLEEAKIYDSGTFLIGLRASPEKLKAEKDLMAKLGVVTGSYKEEFQVRLGSRIEEETGYRAEFSRPDLTFTVNQEDLGYRVSVRSIYVKGRYLKKRRGIPQSPWIKPGAGKDQEKSVSEYIGKVVCDSFEGSDYNFYASGREDVDALMLGTGRPFYVEVRNPRRRRSEMGNIAANVLSFSRGGVEVVGLSLADPMEVEEMKNSRPDKTYEVGITVDGEMPPDIFENLRKFQNYKISQKTPSRVLGIRRDKVREKSIRSTEVIRISGNNIILRIRAEAGTYIKEFITGDKGRTVPSLKSELDINVKIDYLDVLEVK